MATAPPGSPPPVRGPRPEASEGDFERALGRRILQSERLRVKLLAWLLGATTVPAVIQVLLRGDAVPNFRALPLIALAMLLFELGLLPLLDRSLAREEPGPSWRRWLWAAVEGWGSASTPAVR